MLTSYIIHGTITPASCPDGGTGTLLANSPTMEPLIIPEFICPVCPSLLLAVSQPELNVSGEQERIVAFHRGYFHFHLFYEGGFIPETRGHDASSHPSVGFYISWIGASKTFPTVVLLAKAADVCSKPPAGAPWRLPVSPERGRELAGSQEEEAERHLGQAGVRTRFSGASGLWRRFFFLFLFDT